MGMRRLLIDTNIYSYALKGERWGYRSSQESG